jgi:hypothetical protein
VQVAACVCKARVCGAAIACLSVPEDMLLVHHYDGTQVLPFASLAEFSLSVVHASERLFFLPQRCTAAVCYVDD